jgi:hypothetical protein
MALWQTNFGPSGVFLPDYLFEPANLLTMTAIVDMGPQERARIFGGTAIEVYRLANLNEAVLLFL